MLSSMTLLLATSISTLDSGLAAGMAARINEYAADHGGVPPRTWDDLRPYVDFGRLEINIGGKLETRMILFGEVKPLVDGAVKTNIVAMTAFPIEEDRRESIGRYIVYQDKSLRFVARWESEEMIQAALLNSNLEMVSPPVYRERLFKPLYPEYGMRLFQDAMSQGVSIEHASATIERHVNDVSNRRKPAVETWAELVKQGASPDQTHPMVKSTSGNFQGSSNPPSVDAASNNLSRKSYYLVIVCITITMLAALGVYFLKRRG